MDKDKKKVVLESVTFIINNVKEIKKADGRVFYILDLYNEDLGGCVLLSNVANPSKLVIGKNYRNFQLRINAVE